MGVLRVRAKTAQKRKHGMAEKEIERGTKGRRNCDIGQKGKNLGGQI